MKSFLFHDKCLLLTILLITLLGLLFGTSLFMPGLVEKPAMGGAIQSMDALGIEEKLSVERGDGTPKIIVLTTLAWFYGHRLDLLFGLCLAAAGLMFLLQLHHRRLPGRFANTLLGLTLGFGPASTVNRQGEGEDRQLLIPLTVMVGSPILNIVVLTLMFILLPAPIAWIKLGLTLMFILTAIPLIDRIFGGKSLLREGAFDGQRAQRGFALSLQRRLGEPDNATWRSAGKWLVRGYLQSFLHLAMIIVPLLILAVLSGKLMAEVAPLDDLFVDIYGKPMVLTGMFLLSLTGLLISGPITFDVLVVAILLMGGVPAHFAMALLFTLGIFSDYSCRKVWKAVQAKVALLLFSGVIFLSVFAASSLNLYEKWRVSQQSQMVFDTYWKQLKPLPEREIRIPRGEPIHTLSTTSMHNASAWQPVSLETPPGITVQRLPFQERAGQSDRLFETFYGDRIGLQRVDNLPLIDKFITPFYRLNPIAAGDVHGDGWVDLVLGSDHGVHLYANRGDGSFVIQEIPVPDLREMAVGNTALMDLNNDGWLDIFIGTYRAGNFVLYNDQGHFAADQLHPLPKSVANLASAVTFGDIDHNGTLDIAVGNWTAGVYTTEAPLDSTNYILWNLEGGFQSELLPGVAAETLSMLLSDFNMDGHLDLMVGNDWLPPDLFYLGHGNRKLTEVTAADGLIPRVPDSTMSIDSADIDNDLVLEVFLAQVTDLPPVQDYMNALPIQELCEGSEIDDPQWLADCPRMVTLNRVTSEGRGIRDVQQCLSLEAVRDQDRCLAIQLLKQSVFVDRDPTLCRQFPERHQDVAAICRAAHEKKAPFTPADQQRAIPHIFKDNVFLFAEQGGERFTDRAAEMGLSDTGWTWDARFGDFDNDGWQDLFAVNGNSMGELRESNFYFRNQQGEGFEDQTEAAGLVNFLATGGKVHVDLDNDGDLDLVVVPFTGPIFVYRNTTRENRAIVFEFQDFRGNRFGIGNKVIIHYGADESQHQIREIKGGGGFMSFDPSRAHFGLGGNETVTRVDIHWSTGEKTTLQGEFSAGARYRITRR